MEKSRIFRITKVACAAVADTTATLLYGYRTHSAHAHKEIVCKYFNLEQSVIQTNSRKREIVQARQITMYLAKKYTDSSFSHIGKIVGKKDHATVLHACKTIKDQIETSKSFRSSVEEIEVLLKN